SARLVATVALASYHGHVKNVVHRDIKPTNILMEGNTPNLSDFGLARLLDAKGDKTATGTVLGTPWYMAPEQGAGKTGEVGPTSDVWALGAVLFECVVGRPPFGNDIYLDVLAR